VAQFEVRLRGADNSGAWRLVVSSPTGMVGFVHFHCHCKFDLIVTLLINPNFRSPGSTSSSLNRPESYKHTVLFESCRLPLTFFMCLWSSSASRWRKF